MITSIEQWVILLQKSDSLVGLPLCAVGLALALGGWRLWKVSVVGTFALIGGVLGVLLADKPGDQGLYAIAGAALLGVGSFPPANYSIAVLGGLISAGITHMTLSPLSIGGWPLWIAVGLAFAVCTALSYVYLRQVIVIVTSFEGAVLVVSGMVALVSEVPQLFKFFRGISADYWFFVPFLLLVPTVVGCMLQLADVRQRDSGMASR
ncbi:MAG: hypothetical protein JSV19_03025 [Phycisphaerales bacterium]|nr:MAG: hypothetical protein JSV19_03025 [Phycisphaerales bacterium]